MAKGKWKRNPIAKNLNVNKPKIIPDKRRKAKEKIAEKEQQIYEDERKRDKTSYSPIGDIEHL